MCSESLHACNKGTLSQRQLYESCGVCDNGIFVQANTCFLSITGPVQGSYPSSINPAGHQLGKLAMGRMGRGRNGSAR